MVGGIIMAHGDDAGLRLPPKLAPIQVCSHIFNLSKPQLAQSAFSRRVNFALHFDMLQLSRALRRAKLCLLDGQVKIGSGKSLPAAFTGTLLRTMSGVFRGSWPTSCHV